MNSQILHHRRTAARILLAVFLPMLLLASLHHHDLAVTAVDTTCNACLHHLHHDGHLVANPQHACNCVLCSFLTLSYLTPPVVTVPSPCSTQYVFIPCCKGRIVACPQLLNPGRAPPVARYNMPSA